MPDFGSSFSGLANGRKLTGAELIRAIRFMIAAEYEATQLYMQLAESTDNKLARAVLKEIADEELVHAGEFLRLLHEVAPDEERLYAKGAKEVEEAIDESKQNTAHGSPTNNGMRHRPSRACGPSRNGAEKARGKPVEAD